MKEPFGEYYCIFKIHGHMINVNKMRQVENLAMPVVYQALSRTDIVCSPTASLEVAQGAYDDPAVVEGSDAQHAALQALALWYTTQDRREAVVADLAFASRSERHMLPIRERYETALQSGAPCTSAVILTMMGHRQK
jgi:hypothetical protein